MKHNWKLLAVIMLVVVSATGCQDDTETVTTKEGTELEGPAEYNDYLVQRQNEVIGKFRALNDAYDSFDSSAVETAHGDLQQQVEKTIGEVDQLPAYGQDSTLRDAALGMFRFYKELTNKELKRIGEIVSQGKNNIPDYEVDEVDSLYNSFRQEIQTHETAFKDAQQQFAEANGMTIKKKGE